MTGRAPRQFSRQAITELPATLAAQSWGAGLLRALAKATEPQVSDRYNTVQEFWEDLARLKLGARSEAEEEDEATVVRMRLSGTSTAERAAARPHFQPILSAPLEGSRPQKARIVVELPQHESRNRAGKAAGQQQNGAGSNAAQGATAQVNVSHRSISDGTLYGRGASNPVVTKDKAVAEAEASVLHRTELKERRAAELRSRREAERSYFDSLRAVISSDWLRRVFIIFLVAAVIGLAASTYYYFAGHKGDIKDIFHGDLKDIFQGKDGLIGNAINVNLRSEPGGSVLGMMPAGTRVHVLDVSGNWLKIKVVNWAGPQPPNAPESGWVDKQYVIK
jgi:hypothetical protein